MALLLLPLAAAAQPFSAGFAATGSTDLRGALDLEGTLAGLVLGGAGTATVGTDAATARLVNVPVEVLVVNAPAGQPFHATAQRLAEEPGPTVALAGGFSAEFRGDGGELRLLPDGGALAVAARGTGGHLAEAETDLVGDPASPFADLQHADGAPTFASGAYSVARLAAPAFQSEGRSVLLVAGPLVHVAGHADVFTGKRLNATRSTIDPVTGSGRYVYDTWVLVVRGSRATITLDGVHADFALAQLSARFDGTGLWHGIAGHAQYAGSTLPDKQQTLEANGTFQLSQHASGPRAVWTVAGPARYVNVDTESAGAAALATGAALTGIALLLALLTAPARALLTLVLGRSTPRLLKAKPLASRTRRAILETIHREQPVTLPRLQDATGISRGNLRYHLRILAAHDILQVVRSGRDGRGAAFMLNSSSLMFKTPGIAQVPGAEQEARRAGAVLARVNSHPVRKAILRQLLERGPLAYEELRDALVAERVVESWPHSSASYQLNLLVQAGALATEWRDRRKLYVANIDPAQAAVTQYGNFLGSKEVLALVRALRDVGGGTFDQLAGELRVQDDRAQRRTLRGKLEELVGLAIVDHDAARGTYALTPPMERIAHHLLKEAA